jgi:hypothetical protein
MLPRRRHLIVAGVCLLGALSLAWVLVARLNRRIAEASSQERFRQTRVRPLSFRALARPGAHLEAIGDERVSGIAFARGELAVAGGSGLWLGHEHLDVTTGLPFLRIQALTSWRGTPVVAFEREGWARIGAAGAEEAMTGWGRLHVRALLETAAGELLVGAREGLFRVAFGSNEMERLEREPVRALAIGPAGVIASGGETGLRLVSISGAPAEIVPTPDPWIDDLGFDRASGRLWAATPIGVALSAAGIGAGTASVAGTFGALVIHPRGGDATRGVFFKDAFRAIPFGTEPRVAALRLDGSRQEETTPEVFRRLFTLAGALWADGPSGLWRKDERNGWTLERKRSESALPLPRVTALLEDRGTLWAGFFDGGLARSPLQTWDAPLSFSALAGSDAWGINALLPAGGAVVAATLHGAFRIEGGRAVALEGAGGAFSLAATRSGVVVGYGQGVYFPEKRLLSAFHGLPGNQAIALSYASGRDALWVGTPSGLGRIDKRRVDFRAVTGDGKLPHPWITALVDRGDSLLVATYGGGVTRRSGEGRTETWTPFVETSALKVNAGAMLVDPAGRIWIGTQGHGIWRSDRTQSRFERLDSPLPSPDVFSLALVPHDSPAAVLVGTDEGLARIPLQKLSETEN